MSKILVVAPHADDELIGVGGTLLKQKAMGNTIQIVLVSCVDSSMDHLNQGVVRSQTRKEEFHNSSTALSTCKPIVLEYTEARLDRYSVSDIVRDLDSILSDFAPEVYVYPEPSYHQDHMIVNQACTASARPTKAQKPSKILTYEVPTSTWVGSGTPFIPNYYVDICDTIDMKLSLFEEVYKSQFTMSERRKLAANGIREHAIYRGMECGTQFAEAFKLLYNISK